MPVNALSGTLSTSAYFLSMFLLLFALASPVKTAFQESDLRAAQEVASGVALQIDDLSPGMVSTLRLDASPGVSLRVSVAGSGVTAVVDGESASATVRWEMANFTLLVGRDYTIAVETGVDDGGPTVWYLGVVRLEA